MTIADGNVTDSEFGSLDGAAAFLSNLMPDKEQKGSDASEKPSKTVEEQETSAEETPESEETSENTPEDSEEQENPEEGKQKSDEKKYVDGDDAYVKIKEGDQEHEVPVKNLKRLFGQEAALTRRSQEVAEQRKVIEQQRLTYAAKLDALVKKATEKANQYRQVNFMALMKDPSVTPEMLGALQDEARRALEEETFLKSELKEFTDGVQKQRQEELVNVARESVKHLTDENSPYYVEGFNKQYYDTMRQFAIDNGISREVANQIVDAPTLKLLHMAMLYSKGASKVTTKVVNKTAKKIVKNTTRAIQPQTKPNAEKQKKAFERLQEHGSTDNAAEAFLARWESGPSE